MAKDVEECPDCGSALPVADGYVIWCADCNWNLNPLKKEDRPAFLAAAIRKFQKASGNALKEAAKTNGLERSGGIFGRALLILCALVINLTTVILLIAGVLMVVVAFRVSTAIVPALLLLTISWMVRPRFGKVPKQSISREGHRKLFSLVDRVCDSLNTPRFDLIVVDEQFNAACGRVGLSQKRVLTLGVPFVEVLTPQELVALVAHEAAHGAGGDPLRGMLAGVSINTLYQWYRILYPDALVDPDAGLANIVAVPLRCLLMAIAKLIELLALGLVCLVYRDSQLSEYRADLLSAKTAGTDANLSLLRKTNYASTIEIAIQKHTVGRQGSSLWDLLRDRLSRMPDREIERLERIEALNGPTFMNSHPPSRYRAEVIESLPFTTPCVKLSEGEFAEIKTELSDRYAWAEEKLKDNYLSTVYR